MGWMAHGNPFTRSADARVERDKCQNLSLTQGGETLLTSTAGRTPYLPSVLPILSLPSPPQTHVGNVSHQDR
jgi:hypothetical protein